MRRARERVKCLLAAILLFVAPLPCAIAQTSSDETEAGGVRAVAPERHEFLYLRPLTEAIPRELVAFVAKNGEPDELALEGQTYSPGYTLGDLVQAKCGSIQDGYIDSLKVANDLGQRAIGADSTLEELGSAIRLPQCLFISRSTAEKPLTYKVERNEDLSSIYDSFTGGGYDPAALEDYFSGRSMPLDYVRFGEQVTLPFVTSTTEVTVNGSMGDWSSFIASNSDFVNVVGLEGTVPYGEIISSVDMSDENGESTESSCTNDNVDYPFRADRVGAAVELLLSNDRRLRPAIIGIVDNGFLGVKVEHASRAYVEPFIERIFLLEQFANLGPITFDNGRLYAIGFLNVDSLVVNSLSGHGTHVAGVAMGGETFKDVFSSLFEPDYSYIKLLPIALNRSRKALPLGSETQLTSTLRTLPARSRPSIVNLSIAFAPTDSLDLRRVKRHLADLIRSTEYRETLFVAAAGNDGQDISRLDSQIYPAAFGGMHGLNVITVASHDSDDQFSPFSNVGNEHVDIAAPGCKIQSWLDYETVSPLSGTSQSAPHVSFTAALLKTAWDVGAVRLKNRIVYSGDLFEDLAQRPLVRSRSKLNIAKALFVDFDYIAIRQDGRLLEYLGFISPVSQLACTDQGREVNRRWRDVWAIKRQPEDGVTIFFGDKEDENIEVCSGVLRSHTSRGDENLIAFAPVYSIDGPDINAIEDASGIRRTILASDVIEVIRSE